MKTCESCPSFLSPERAQDRFTRPLGSPMCGRHGYVLGYSGQPQEDATQTRMAFAANCEDHGKELPGTPVSLRPRVTSISQDVINEGPTNAQVTSCNACKNCVKHDRVAMEFGWPLSLCKAKGTLIFDPSTEHRQCEWANPGMPSNDLREVELRKEFQPGFIFGAPGEWSPVTLNPNKPFDPETYETDIPVDPEDQADGIRAWRRLTCPWGTGKTVYLPIFDRDFFTPEQQAKIPRAGDDHNPELYVDYSNLLWRFGVTTWQRGHTLLIQSLPGLGKTEFTYYVAWAMQVPWTRIFFTDSIEWDDVFGTLLFVDNETKWIDGEFTEAFGEIGVICMDEPNLARSEIISTLRPSTERNARIYLNTSAKRPHESRGGDDEVKHIVREGHRYNFRVWCANPAWDPRNIGTKELAAADISRLSPAILETPPKAIEKQIIRTACKELEDFDIPEDLLVDLMKVSDDLRELSEGHEFPGTWGIRENIDVAGNLAWYPFEEAFRMTALNYLEPETAKSIIEASIQTIRS